MQHAGEFLTKRHELWWGTGNNGKSTKANEVCAGMAHVRVDPFALAHLPPFHIYWMALNNKVVLIDDVDVGKDTAPVLRTILGNDSDGRHVILIMNCNPATSGMPADLLKEFDIIHFDKVYS